MRDKLVKSLMELFEKALTSNIADIDNTPKDEASLNGTNTPTIQDAIDPTKEKEKSSIETAPKTNIQEVESETKLESKGPSFGTLFQSFNLGPTLRETPSGNVLDNVKSANIDYVEAAKHTKNQIMTAEELQKLQSNEKIKKAKTDQIEDMMYKKDIQRCGGYTKLSSLYPDDIEKGYMGFEAVKRKAAEGGAENPAAVAANIGRKKYGKERYNQMIAAGKPGGKKGKAASGKVKKADTNGEVKKNENLKKKQGIPKGISPEKHESCVQQVKQKGHDKVSAIKICNASLQNAKKVRE